MHTDTNTNTKHIFTKTKKFFNFFFLLNYLIKYRALSGFKADFGPLLGTSNFPARDASENMKMDVYNLVDTLKRCEKLRAQGKHGETLYC